MTEPFYPKQSDVFAVPDDAIRYIRQQYMDR
jgi:hypothetical protein